MRKQILVFSLSVLVVAGSAVAVATGTAGRSAAKKHSFSAVLNIKQEVPKEKGAPANAGGTFKATLTGTKLEWKLTFSHLTGKATAAHIHLGVRGKSGAVLVPLCGPCPAAIEQGQNNLTAAQVKAILKSGATYVNVHTAKNPGGEIRGQLT